MYITTDNFSGQGNITSNGGSAGGGGGSGGRIAIYVSTSWSFTGILLFLSVEVIYPYSYDKINVSSYLFVSLIGLYVATGGSGGYGILSSAGPGTIYTEDSSSGVAVKKIYCDNANLGNPLSY